ncbi:hypothetical protein LJB90_03615 [Eubacteriales bacterium OttesenSCG-928-G02]|nr:hypothetical protein [Eubacteriales bacterium OttesenSCG-928-G02]
MKKIYLIIIALIIVVSFSACTDENNGKYRIYESFNKGTLGFQGSFSHKNEIQQMEEFVDKKAVKEKTFNIFGIDYILEYKNSIKYEDGIKYDYYTGQKDGNNFSISFDKNSNKIISVLDKIRPADKGIIYNEEELQKLAEESLKDVLDFSLYEYSKITKKLIGVTKNGVE